MAEEYDFERTDDFEADGPEPAESRKALVAEWLGKIEKARKAREKTFKEMRKAQDFAMYGADKKWRDAGKYTVPILPRYINQTVAQLYARNPKTIFKRRQRLEYKLWDGRLDTLQAAMQMAQMGDVSAAAILAEVAQVRQRNESIERMGKTLEILYQYYIDEQSTGFKEQLKATVRRAKVSKVGWVKIGFQRLLEPRPGVIDKIADATDKIRATELALAKLQEGSDEYGETSAKLEQLKLNLADLERDKEMVAREGLVFDFPKSDQIIVDPACTHLRTLTGARWIAHLYERSPEDIEKIYGVDIRGKFRAYSSRNDKECDEKQDDAYARVYEVWDKENLQMFVVCEGYPDFLQEPATPDIYIERFWPFFPLVFNEVEHYSEIYPLSDVEQAKDIQEEYNRSREALREHRIAARPYWVEAAGLSEDEKIKLADHSAHEVVSLKTLVAGQKIEDLIQRGPTAPIDPNLYELESHFNDLLRVVGYQEAQIGAVSGATATESSIAQQAQSASQSDQTDDIDTLLTELAKAGGQILLQHVSKDTVVEIVGEGAVWPDLPQTREEAAKEIYLEAQAGSTGKPNQAASLANMERAAPWLVQLPGVNQEPLVRKYAELLDIPMEELYAEGMPSITAINALLSRGAGNPGENPTGDPTTDPNMQGGAGAQNAENPQVDEPGPQPGYPAPGVA